MLEESRDSVRRSAVRYLLALALHPATLTRGSLDGCEPDLRKHVVEALFERPSEGRHALTLEWVDARIAAGTPEDERLAARALGAMTGSAPVKRLRALLASPDVEVKRLALLSAARRPSPELLDARLPLLLV